MDILSLTPEPPSLQNRDEPQQCVDKEAMSQSQPSGLGPRHCQVVDGMGEVSRDPEVQFFMSFFEIGREEVRWVPGGGCDKAKWQIWKSQLCAVPEGSGGWGGW